MLLAVLLIINFLSRPAVFEESISMECAEKCEPVKGTFVANDEKVILTIDGVSYTFKVSRMLEEHGIVEVETEEMFGHFHIRKFNILLFIRPKNKRIPIQIISYIIK